MNHDYIMYCFHMFSISDSPWQSVSRAHGGARSQCRLRPRRGACAQVPAAPEGVGVVQKVLIIRSGMQFVCVLLNT